MYCSRLLAFPDTTPVPLDTWPIRCSCISGLEMTFGLFACFPSGILSCRNPNGRANPFFATPLFSPQTRPPSEDFSSILVPQQITSRVSRWPPPLLSFSCSPTEQQIGLRRFHFCHLTMPRSAYTDAFTQQRLHVPYHCQVSDKNNGEGQVEREENVAGEEKKKT